ncbi:hypothetical protein GJU40_19090 [Bacillus lacus]|uniref:Uncharacterized protein n=1 Tax=Metabacillus lacus TaxID=1983721 RepID=A0A7X2J2M8_9BACI|nr:hypothetical protein [Metabacillus lacus]MRX74231.1 hypothetical protein [Metabacillus lacus]
MKKILLTGFFAITMMSGCGNMTNEKTGTGTQGVETQVTTNKKSTITPEEEAILEETMKESLAFFKAMQDSDYDALDELLAPSAAIDKENENFIFDMDEGKYEQKFFSGDITMENLEYRYHELQDERTFVVGFAVYQGDSHVTIHLTFVDIEDHWYVQTFITN